MTKKLIGRKPSALSCKEQGFQTRVDKGERETVRPKKYSATSPVMSVIEPFIRQSIDILIDKDGAVYADDIQDRIPRFSRKSITLWLADNGFTKSAGHNSSRWVNVNWRKAGDCCAEQKLSARV
jgi:hypothetical protein